MSPPKEEDYEKKMYADEDQLGVPRFPTVKVIHERLVTREDFTQVAKGERAPFLIFYQSQTHGEGYALVNGRNKWKIYCAGCCQYGFINKKPMTANSAGTHGKFGDKMILCSACKYNYRNFEPLQWESREDVYEYRKKGRLPPDFGKEVIMYEDPEKPPPLGEREIPVPRSKDKKKSKKSKKSRVSKVARMPREEDEEDVHPDSDVERDGSGHPEGNDSDMDKKPAAKPTKKKKSNEPTSYSDASDQESDDSCTMTIRKLREKLATMEAMESERRRYGSFKKRRSSGDTDESDKKRRKHSSSKNSKRSSSSSGKDDTTGSKKPTVAELQEMSHRAKSAKERAMAAKTQKQQKKSAPSTSPTKEELPQAPTTPIDLLNDKFPEAVTSPGFTEMTRKIAEDMNNPESEASHNGQSDYSDETPPPIGSKSRIKAMISASKSSDEGSPSSSSGSKQRPPNHDSDATESDNEDPELNANPDRTRKKTTTKTNTSLPSELVALPVSSRVPRLPAPPVKVSVCPRKRRQNPDRATLRPRMLKFT